MSLEAGSSSRAPWTILESTPPIESRSMWAPVQVDSQMCCFKEEPLGSSPWMWEPINWITRFERPRVEVMEKTNFRTLPGTEKAETIRAGKPTRSR